MMDVFEKIKGFLKRNATGAWIGGLVGVGFGFIEFFKMAWLETVFFPGAMVGGSFSFIINIAWGIFLGAGLQWLLKEKFKL